MIHYHGTPIGGPGQDVARFLINRHALVSFEYQQHMGVVADVCASFVLDNGAFSVWKKGGRLDIDGYLKWVELWHRHPGFDWALIPDVIDGDEGQNDAFLSLWPENLKGYGVPVWHLHESLERLDRLASSFKVIAFGSSGEYKTPGSPLWWQRMRQALNVVCDEIGRPRCKLHGLRMLNPKIFTELPLSSADSTNVGRNCNQLDRFGMYCAPSTWQRAATIAARIEQHNSAPLFQRNEEELTAFLLGLAPK